MTVRQLGGPVQVAYVAVTSEVCPGIPVPRKTAWIRVPSPGRYPATMPGAGGLSGSRQARRTRAAHSRAMAFL
jgi:hypothetical protein